MKKVLFTLLIVCAFWITSAHAAIDTTPKLQQLNAKILPSIWYSTLPITDGEDLQIFAAIQNNSGIDFEGKAKFFVDESIVAEVPFSSTDNSLKDVSVDWVATAGSHSIQVKIVATIPTDKTLISYDSEKSTITIAKKAPVVAPKEAPAAPVPPVTTTDSSSTAVATGAVSGVIANIDHAANTAADQLLTFKKPISTPVTQAPQIITKGKPMVTTIGPVVPTPSTGITPDSIMNTVIDFLANMLRNWGWTLGIIFAIFLIFKIGKSRKEY